MALGIEHLVGHTGAGEAEGFFDAFIFGRSQTGATTLDLRRLDEHAPAELPAAQAARGK